MKIPSAYEVWEKQSNKDVFEKACEKVVRDIEKAAKEGRRKVCFNPPGGQYDAVKRAFADKGYYFTPTGYIGGVWQHTENINW